MEIALLEEWIGSWLEHLGDGEKLEREGVGIDRVQ